VQNADFASPCKFRLLPLQRGTDDALEKKNPCKRLAPYAGILAICQMNRWGTHMIVKTLGSACLPARLPAP